VYVSSEHNLADIHTKNLARDCYRKLAEQIICGQLGRNQRDDVKMVEKSE